MTGQGTQARWGDSMSQHLQRLGSCRKRLYSSVLDSSRTLTLALALGDSSRDRCFPGLEVSPAAEGVCLWKRQPEGNSQTKTACTGSGCSAKTNINNSVSQGIFLLAWSLSRADLNYVTRSANSPSRTSGGWVERSCSFLGWGSGGMCCRGRSPPLSWSSCSRSSRGCSVDGSHWMFETLAGTACCRKDPI